MASLLTPVIILLFALWLLRRASALLALLSKTKGQPGQFLWFRPFRILSEMLPTRDGFNIGVMGAWRAKFDIMERFNSTVVVYTAALPSPGAQCIVGDAEGAREVFTNKKVFGKPIEDYNVLKFFGPNVVVTENDEWRRHRRLTAPSFSERNNAMVWDDSRRIVEEWFSILDSRSDGKGDCLDEDTVESTLQMALMIISAAAFGQRGPWPKDGVEAIIPPGRKMGFIAALKGTLDGLIVKVLLPNWAYSLPLQRPKEVANYFSELEGFLLDMISARKAEKAGGMERGDLFSALLEGVDDEEGKGVLTNQELVGNIFIFLLAGHETTAHTLAFLFTLLALYPEHQEALYKEATSTFGSGTSSYEDYNQLPYALGAVQEALRMYTPVLFIPKIALEDAIVPAHTTPTDGEEPTRRDVFVPKGTRVAVLASALHYNPMYYEDPYAFKPERFIDTPAKKWNRDAWVPFSGGSRACLGQKFALVESVVIISHICQKYTIHVPTNKVEEYKLRAGESERERRERIFKPSNGVTLTPSPLPLVFKKR